MPLITVEDYTKTFSIDILQDRVTGEKYVAKCVGVWDELDGCIGFEVAAAAGPLHFEEVEQLRREPFNWDPEIGLEDDLNTNLNGYLFTELHGCS